MYDIRIVHLPDDPVAKMLLHYATLSSRADIMAIHSVLPPPLPNRISFPARVKLIVKECDWARSSNFHILDGQEHPASLDVWHQGKIAIFTACRHEVEISFFSLSR